LLKEDVGPIPQIFCSTKIKVLSSSRKNTLSFLTEGDFANLEASERISTSFVPREIGLPIFPAHALHKNKLDVIMHLELTSEYEIKERLDAVGLDAYFSPQFAGINRKSRIRTQLIPL
jgi:hypothetical protein